MIEEIKKRKRLQFEFLRLLYQRTVGENNRTKYISVGDIGKDLGLYEPPEGDIELSETEKDKLYEQGRITEEIVIQLKEDGLIELIGYPNPYYNSQVRITNDGINEIENTVLNTELSDNELRGVLLQKYYSMRGNEFIPIDENTFGNAISLSEIFRVSEQLDQYGLIEFKPLRGNDRIVSAVAKITARGIDVVENEGKHSPIQITLINQTIHMTNEKAAEEMLQILRLLKDRTDTEESLMEKANTIIQLQPNFAGIGLNLNELISRLLKEKK